MAINEQSSNKRIGVIGLAKKWSTQQLANAIAKRVGSVVIVAMDSVRLDLQSNDLLYSCIDEHGNKQDYNLCDFDALVIKKVSSLYSPNTIDRLELLRVAEARGVTVLSAPENTLRLINRMSCTISLRNNNIAMPPTLITEDKQAALDFVKQYGDTILKPLFSTKARGMLLVEAKHSAIDQAKQLNDFQSDNPMLYLQQKLNLGGRDLGLVFLGGEYLCAYARVSQSGSWNTTINSGGRYEACTPEASIIKLAQRAQGVFNMDFTTVDIAETERGPVVFEVSAFGGFRGALEGAGVDAAAAYAKYILEKLS